MRRYRTAAVVACAAVLAGQLIAAQTPVVAQAGPTVEWTLITTSPALASDGSPHAVYATAQNGWMIDSNLDQAVRVTATKGALDLGIDLDPHAARPGTGSKTSAVVSMGGDPCGGALPDARILDRHVDESGAVDRLDVVYAVQCSYSKIKNFAIGELRINEPASPVEGSPSLLLWPPVNRDSDVQTLPVRFSAGDGNRHVASVALTGRDHRRFRVTADTCTGASLAPAEHCSVQVQYLLGAYASHAAVLLRDHDGNTIARTRLSAGILPGIDYWGLLAPKDESDTTRSLQIFTQPKASVSADVGNSQDWTLRLNTPRRYGLSSFELGSTTDISWGSVYDVGPSAPASADFTFDSKDYSGATGKVFVAWNDDMVERGLFRIPRVALTFELHVPGWSQPIDGAVGSVATTRMKIPGRGRPPEVAALTHRRHGDAVRFAWTRSTDVAVHSWVARSYPGAVTHGSIRGGKQVYSGTAQQFDFTPSARPATVFIYALDDNGHHSHARRVVLR